MIFISSACVRTNRISEAVIQIAEEGYQNIELSGGTQPEKGYIEKLLFLKEKYRLNFMIHNYFPPPDKNFILNLASLDENIYEKSIEQLKNALKLTRRFKSEKFGFHSGFFVDRPASELGGQFKKDKVVEKEKALDRFSKTVRWLKKNYPDITLYIENNCYSKANFLTYGWNAPLMLLTAADWQRFNKNFEFNLLLDVGHLKVCSQTLGLDLNDELNRLFDKTDYIHISDNDGEHDQNLGLIKDTPLYECLKTKNWNGKTVTLEVYEGFPALNKTYMIISSMIKGE